jgi:hypothetical protein
VIVKPVKTEPSIGEKEKGTDEPDMPPEPSNEEPEPAHPSGKAVAFSLAPLRMGSLKEEVPEDEPEVPLEQSFEEPMKPSADMSAKGPALEEAGNGEGELPPEPELSEDLVEKAESVPPPSSPTPEQVAPEPVEKKETSASDELEKMLAELRKKREG